MKWDYHYPRGPRSCPSYVVSSRHHLIDPIRPTRGHIAISPHGGLSGSALPKFPQSAFWTPAATARGSVRHARVQKSEQRSGYGGAPRLLPPHTTLLTG